MPLAMFVDCFGHLLCTIVGGIKSTSYIDANQKFPKIANVSANSFCTAVLFSSVMFHATCVQHHTIQNVTFDFKKYFVNPVK